jgi:hypothetical protein
MGVKIINLILLKEGHFLSRLSISHGKENCKAIFKAIEREQEKRGNL